MLSRFSGLLKTATSRSATVSFTSQRRFSAAPAPGSAPATKKKTDVFVPDPHKLYVTLSTPNTTIFRNKEVVSVTVPAVDGASEYLYAAVPAITELKPGPLLVKHSEGNVEKFFISSGFAFMTKDSFCNVNVVEAVKFQDLDATEATRAFKQAESDLASAQTNEAKVKAQIEIETFQNILLEIGSKA
eukprot:TRINITY_DN15242_c0_g1_i1.p1 TRINITY_DN15242_c0_g1~~TRINITY_DN15242_c0_g1_i1.p1  ORF type:complete len:187 (+),score=43.26 TRINITY_DN15242_c0_g1_i1:172-732(+)